MGSHHFLVAVASKALESTDAAAANELERLVELADISLKASDPELKITVLTSVAPGGLMLAFNEGAPDGSRLFVEKLGAFAARLGRSDICVVVTAGVLDPVRESWISTNFEGAPAIAAARVLSKLEPGDLALLLPGQGVDGITKIWPISRVGREKVLPGKHEGETFTALIVSGAFSDTHLTKRKNGNETQVTPRVNSDAIRKSYLSRFSVETSRLGVEHYIDLDLHWAREIRPPNVVGQVSVSDTHSTTLLNAVEDFPDRPIGIIGAPGAGKTTILVQYVRTVAAMAERMPVYVQMALYRPGRDLESLLNLREFSIEQRQQLLHDGNLVIALDGINEARCDSIDDVFHEIVEFVSVYPKNRYLLSCRTAEFPQWVRGYIEEFHLLPVTAEQIATQFKALLGHEMGEKWVQRLASRDVDWLHLRELCFNPLLLTMVLALLRDSGLSALDSIESKANLYRAFLDTLYKREAEKPKDSEWRRILPFGLRDTLLSILAYRMQATETVAVEEVVLQEWIRDELQRSKHHQWWESHKRPSIPTLLGSILNRPPFRLVEDAPTRIRQFAFMHQSFGEYYAARYYERLLSSGEISWADLDPLIVDKTRRHWEVLELLGGLLDKPETLISRVTWLATEQRDQVLLMLAARCVRAAPHAPEGFADDVRIRMLDAFKNWGRPFDYDLIHAMAEALSQVGDRFPRRLREDFERFASKYSHVRPAQLHETTTETLMQLCLGSSSLAVDAAYTLGQRSYGNESERRDVATFLSTNLSKVQQAVREQMIVALKQIAHPESIDALTSIVKDSSQSARARAYALNALGAVCDLSSVGTVVEYLKDRRNTYRDSASWSLQMLGRRAQQEDRNVFEQIKSIYIDCLKAESSDLEGRYCKGNIMYSLGSLKAVEYVDNIIAVLNSESDPYVIEDGIQALGLLEDSRATTLVRAFLSNGDPVVRMKAIETIGQLRAKECIADVRDMLEDEFPIVREAAASTLKSLESMNIPAPR